MFGFLQGFAYGLFVSCIAWFFIGLAKPRLAVPTEPPRRWQAVVRYWFVFPFIAFLLWLTSLWGGFGPTFGGWLAGLLAIAVEVPLERRWRRWRRQRAERREQSALAAAAARRHAERERSQREAGLTVLDPERPPPDADDVVLALCRAKQGLLEARRPELAGLADRLYTRYQRVLVELDAKFERAELTSQRARGLVAEVCRSAVDDLSAMASLARGVAGVDVGFVRRRLAQRDPLPAAEQEALQRRLQLVEDGERRLRELSGRNEAALTALDDAAVAVAAIATDRPQASVAANQALQDLNRFIDRAERYGRRGSS